MQAWVQVLAIGLLFLYGLLYLWLMHRKQTEMEKEIDLLRKMEIQINLLINRQNHPMYPPVAKTPKDPLESSGVAGSGGAGAGSDLSRTRDL